MLITKYFGHLLELEPGIHPKVYKVSADVFTILYNYQVSTCPNTYLN